MVVAAYRANRYDVAAGEPYLALLRLLRDKDYFVLTTNVDHQPGWRASPKARLFYTQGDYGLWQCAAPCHDGTYDNEAAGGLWRRRSADCGSPRAAALSGLRRADDDEPAVRRALRSDEGLVCGGGPLRSAFLRRLRGRRVLFLELGVGANTPAVIKFPFWRMTAANPDAVYACVRTRLRLLSGGDRGAVALYPRGHFGGAGGAGGNGLTNRGGCGILLQKQVLRRGPSDEHADTGNRSACFCGDLPKPT